MAINTKSRSISNFKTFLFKTIYINKMVKIQNAITYRKFLLIHIKKRVVEYKAFGILQFKLQQVYAIKAYIFMIKVKSVNQSNH
jgi:hypothetical protein